MEAQTGCGAYRRCGSESFAASTSARALEITPRAEFGPSVPMLWWLFLRACSAPPPNTIVRQAEMLAASVEWVMKDLGLRSSGRGHGAGGAA